MFTSCSKSPQKVTTTTTSKTDTIIPQPLPNTVAKTDTLNVMAYNILSYGDGCQGTTTALNGYFRTIIQYTQPDLLSCEKMNSFVLPSSLPVMQSV